MVKPCLGNWAEGSCGLLLVGRDVGDQGVLSFFVGIHGEQQHVGTEASNHLGTSHNRDSNLISHKDPRSAFFRCATIMKTSSEWPSISGRLGNGMDRYVD